MGAHLCECMRMADTPGARIRERREELDISPGTFAQRVQIVTGSLRNIENGTKKPSRRLLNRIARELALPFAELAQAYADAAEQKDDERKDEPTHPTRRQEKEQDKTGPKRATDELPVAS